MACLSLGACLALGCSLGELFTGDRPRPALDSDDCFETLPATPVLSASEAAVQSSRRLITVRALRSSGAGAEPVPVRIRIGTCDVRKDDLHPGADGGAVGPVGLWEGFTIVPESAHHRFELDVVDTLRCSSRVDPTQESSSMDCALGPTGAVTFAVEANRPIPDLVDWHLPICVSVRTIDKHVRACSDPEPKDQRERGASRCRDPDYANEQWFHHQVFVALVSGAATKVAFEEPTVRSPIETGCEARCEDYTPALITTVGIVVGDTPEGALNSALFARANTSQTIDVRLITGQDETASLFLSTDQACLPSSGATGPCPSADGACKVTIDEGGRQSTPVHVCATGVAQRFQLVASIQRPEETGIRPSDLAAELEATVDRFFVSRASGVPTLEASWCGGEIPASLERIEIASANGGRVVGILGDSLRLDLLCRSDSVGDDVVDHDRDDDAGVDTQSVEDCLQQLDTVYVGSQACPLTQESSP